MISYDCATELNEIVNHPEMIDKVMKKSPEAWLKIAAQLVSKDFDIKQSGDVQVRIVRFKDMNK